MRVCLKYDNNAIWNNGLYHAICIGQTFLTINNQFGHRILKYINTNRTQLVNIYNFSLP